MKKINLIYWITTGLFGAFMMLSAIPDIMLVPDAVTFMTHLGYPNYFTVFIGVAKALGVIAILTPGFPRLKEWAYAGFFFDLIGAWYSGLAVGDPIGPSFGMLIPIAIGTVSYIYHHKRLKAIAELQTAQA